MQPGICAYSAGLAAQMGTLCDLGDDDVKVVHAAPYASEHTTMAWSPSLWAREEMIYKTHNMSFSFRGIELSMQKPQCTSAGSRYGSGPGTRGGDLVPSQFGGGKLGCGKFGGSKGQGMRHGACKAQGDGGTKQEAPGVPNVCTPHTSPVAPVV